MKPFFTYLCYLVSKNTLAWFNRPQPCRAHRPDYSSSVTKRFQRCTRSWWTRVGEGHRKAHSARTDRPTIQERTWPRKNNLECPPDCTKIPPDKLKIKQEKLTKDSWRSRGKKEFGTGRNGKQKQPVMKNLKSDHQVRTTAQQQRLFLSWPWA